MTLGTHVTTIPASLGPGEGSVGADGPWGIGGHVWGQHGLRAMLLCLGQGDTVTPVPPGPWHTWGAGEARGRGAEQWGCYLGRGQECPLSHSPSWLPVSLHCSCGPSATSLSSPVPAPQGLLGRDSGDNPEPRGGSSTAGRGQDCPVKNGPGGLARPQPLGAAERRRKRGRERKWLRFLR